MFKRLIGIDYGKSRIGIASGQMVTRTATPVSTITAKNGVPNWYQFDYIINQWLPHKIIVGLPIDTKDQETKITKEVRDFVKTIEERYQKTIDLVTEAFSTLEAHCLLKKTRKNSSSHLRVDSIAACIILETWMNIN